MADATSEIFPVTNTLRCKLSLGKEIKNKLQQIPGRLDLFKASCFGPWLDVECPKNDPALVHTILTTQVCKTEESTKKEVLYFKIGGRVLQFGPQEFCLITGLYFGNQIFPSNNPDVPFKSRVFHDVVDDTLKISKLRELFEDVDNFNRLTNEDAVRVCLLLLLKKGFLGRDGDISVENNLLRLVEDIYSWNRFPWGSYIWSTTWSQLHDALGGDRRKQMLESLKAGRKPSYSLHGFTWAFKIWIYEVLPELRRRIPYVDTVPRALGWRESTRLTSADCKELLRRTFLDGNRPTPMRPTEAETTTEWWVASLRFFSGLPDIDHSSRAPKRPREASLSKSPEPSFIRQHVKLEDEPGQSSLPGHNHIPHSNATTTRLDPATSAPNPINHVVSTEIPIEMRLRRLEDERDVMETRLRRVEQERDVMLTRLRKVEEERDMMFSRLMRLEEFVNVLQRDRHLISSYSRPGN